MPQHDVFLSYSRKDTPQMQRVRDALRAEDIKVWTDEGIEAGTPAWQRSLKENMHEAQSLVVLLSPDAEQSEWVLIEISLAKRYNLLIIPILLHGKRIDSVPTPLTNYQDIDARTDFYEAMSQLIDTLHKKLNTPSHSYSAQQPKSERVSQRQQHQRPPAPRNPQQQPSATVSAMPQYQTSIRKLDAWNPFDWFVLLWWILFKPITYFQYRSEHGNPKAVRGALISTLAWGSSFISVVAIIFQPNIERNYISLITLLGLIIYWLVSCIVSYSFIGKFMVIIVAAFSLPTALHTFGGQTIIIGDIETHIAPILILAGAVTLITTSVVVLFDIKRDIKQRKANFLNYVIFAALILSYGFLIWVYWLGGWQVLGLVG